MKDYPATRGSATGVGDGEDAQAKSNIIPSTALDQINIQNNDGASKNEQIPLSVWLQREKKRSTKMQERLRVAIAVTKQLVDIHDGTGANKYCGAQLSLVNIMLDIGDGYCVATLNSVKDGGSAQKEADMIQLGHILNDIFGGDSSNMGSKHGEQKTGEEQTKKRGKGQQSIEDLPLYLTCLVSSLIGTSPNPTGVIVQYESVKQVLQDLQVASNKPEIYLTKFCCDVSKNNNWLDIPHAFYGRKSELSLLLNSLDTVLRFGQPVLVSVSGYAGTGKTALLNQIKKPLSDAGGFLIRGKFDKTKSPNTVIFSALDEFFGAVNNIGGELRAELKQCIPESVGCGLGLLTSAMPNLRSLLMGEERGDDTDVEFDIEETTVSHQRWKFVLCKLINVISSKAHPITLYLDDLHWCDEVTLDMIQTVIMDPDIRYCLFMVSYRISSSNSDELGVKKILTTIQTQGVRLVSLKLSSIEKESVNALVSEILCIPPFLCQTLSTVVHNKTGGLILFCINFVKSLHELQMIKFDMNRRTWQYNVNDIRQKKVPSDVVQHLSERICRLPKNIQSLLKIAACLGFEFGVDLLQMAIKGNMELLPHVLESGFLIEIPTSNRIVWAHDQIHLAAYELIPLNKRQSSRLLIGSRIYMNTSSEELLHKVIFDIVNNMNVGLKLITSQEQRNEVAQLNLIAGRKAQAASSFSAAADYFTVGIGLLADDCWKCNYEQTNILHQAASEALFVAADFDRMKNITDKHLKHAECLDDKLHAYYCLVRYLHASSNVKEAAEMALSILEELGQTFPTLSEVTPELVYKEAVSTQEASRNITKQDLVEAPRLTDERMKWTIRFLYCLMKYVFSTCPLAMPLVACRIVALSSEHGNCPESAMGIGCFSNVVLNVLDDIDEAYRLAKLTLCFPEMFAAQALAPKLITYYHSYTSFWKEPLQATCDALGKCDQDLLMLGDVECASVAMFNHCRQSLFSGNDLSTVDKECRSVTAKMAKLQQIPSCLSHSSHHLIILTLRGDETTQNLFAGFSGAFNGEVKNEDDLLKHAMSTAKAGIVQAIRFNRLFLAYWFKRYDEAAELAALYQSRMLVSLIDAYHTFYEGLTALCLARRRCLNEPKWLEIGEKAVSQYVDWETHSTWNWQNKLLLLQAECHFSKGEMGKAEEKYKLAIDSARRHRFVHEEGLANELYSAFHSANGNVDERKKYIAAARVCYEKWGAHALVDLLDASTSF